MHTESAAKEAAGMHGRSKKGKTRCTRTVLRIPDLEQSKTAVLNSLPAKTSQESYAHDIDEFIAWYCSEPRLAFNRPLVLRYRIRSEEHRVGKVSRLQTCALPIFPPRLLKNLTLTTSTSLLHGTAQIRALPSIAPWFFAIE